MAAAASTQRTTTVSPMGESDQDEMPRGVCRMGLIDPWLT